ncbi:MAG: hypothetical protein FJ399_11380, partial [Verrucomicrobia bacterium]|nr:hypothetical protein [Verrucomicrobiota bacterium]
MISTARSLGARAPRLPAKLLPLLFLGMASISADASETGTVRGRVFNPSVQAYVRNAEVRIENSNLVTSTESDGSFTLNYVPVGEVTLTVAFSGYQTIRQTFAVARDEVSVREIALGAPGGTGASEEGVVHLSAFTVTSDREGNAKAVMEQKRNMNVTVSVGSEAFGDIVDGNVGEFLKFVPGVDVDYVESAARSPRLGGMDPQYVGVSFDGVKLASADGNRGGDLGRATSFDAFSVSAIESIEISRTTSSDMDADAPAGSITIKTRRAFDRKGRRIGYNV